MKFFFVFFFQNGGAQSFRRVVIDGSVIEADFNESNSENDLFDPFFDPDKVDDMNVNIKMNADYDENVALLRFIEDDLSDSDDEFDGFQIISDYLFFKMYSTI